MAAKRIPHGEKRRPGARERILHGEGRRPASAKRIPLKRFLALYGIYAKMDLMWFLRDSKYAILGILGDAVSNLTAVAGIFLLAWRFDGVGGMTRYEVLFMLGYTTLITGVFQTFFASNNTGHISRRIGRGQIDHMLIQPLPLPVQLLAEGFIPFTGSSNLVTGSLILAAAVHFMEIALPWWWIFSLIGNVAVTMLIILSESYLYSSVAFCAPAAAEEISYYVIDLRSPLSQYPLSGMPLQLQIPLITAVPAGLLAWFPTMALLGKPPLSLTSFFPVLVAVLFFLLAQFTFRKGMMHYVKTGSSRYLTQGYRR